MNLTDVIIALSKSEINYEEQSDIEKYFTEGGDWISFIGQIALHKLFCRTYFHFYKYNWIPLIPPYIYKLLRENFELYKYKSAITRKNLLSLVEKFNEIGLNYCIIKGIPLEKDLFKDNVRECNDTDILLSVKDLQEADNILRELGYARRTYDPKTNTFMTNRTQDIFYIINTHQTSPYRKLINAPFYKYDIIDLQFEFTLNKKFNYDIDTECLLRNKIFFKVCNTCVPTLESFDNFLILCTHLYGEAILIQEIKKGKDLQLSKIADIYEWIEKYYDIYDWKEKIYLIKEHGFLLPVAYCIYLVLFIYKSEKAQVLYELLNIENWDFLDEYRDASFHIKKWETPVLDRIFNTDRFTVN